MGNLPVIGHTVPIPVNTDGPVHPAGAKHIDVLKLVVIQLPHAHIGIDIAVAAAFALLGEGGDQFFGNAHVRPARRLRAVDVKAHVVKLIDCIAGPFGGKGHQAHRCGGRALLTVDRVESGRIGRIVILRFNPIVAAGNI